MSDETGFGQEAADLQLSNAEVTACNANESYAEAFMSAVSLIDPTQNDGLPGNSTTAFDIPEADFSVFEQKSIQNISNTSRRQSLLQTFDPLCGVRNADASMARRLGQIDEQAELSHDSKGRASVEFSGNASSLLGTSVTAHLKERLTDSPNLISMDDSGLAGDRRRAIVDINANAVGTKSKFPDNDGEPQSEAQGAPTLSERGKAGSVRSDAPSSGFTNPLDESIGSLQKTGQEELINGSVKQRTDVDHAWAASPMRGANDENSVQQQTPMRSATASAYRDSRGELFPVTVRDAIQFLSPSFVESFHSPSASRFLDSAAPNRTAAVAGDVLIHTTNRKVEPTGRPSPLKNIGNCTPVKVAPNTWGTEVAHANTPSPVRMNTSAQQANQSINLTNASLQFSARHFAADIEELLASARTRAADSSLLARKLFDNVSKNECVDFNEDAATAGRETLPASRPIEEQTQKPSAFLDAEDTIDRTQPHESVSQCVASRHEAELQAQLVPEELAAPRMNTVTTTTTVAPAVSYETVLERETAKLRAELLAKQAQELRAFESRRSALEQVRIALESQLADAKKCNEELSVLARASDARIRLACQTKRREEAKCLVTHREVQQLSAAFSEHLKLENATKSAIECFEQFEERSRSAKALLDSAARKVADTCERLSKFAKEKAAEAASSRTNVQRETETQREELETKARKLRIDVEAQRGILSAKTKEGAELNQIIGDLSKM